MYTVPELRPPGPGIRLPPGQTAVVWVRLPSAPKLGSWLFARTGLLMLGSCLVSPLCAGLSWLEIGAGKPWYIGEPERETRRALMEAGKGTLLDSSSGVVRMWVRIPAWPVAALVSLSKTLNHNCFVLRMGLKAVGPMCCVMHVKNPGHLLWKSRGLPRCFWIRALSTQQGGYVRATNLLYYYYC